LPLGGLVMLLSLFLLLAVGAPRGKEPTAVMATTTAVQQQSEDETDEMEHEQQQLAAPLLSSEQSYTADGEAVALLLAREVATAPLCVRDVSTARMLQHADCWLLAAAFGVGTGVGLMTINNAAQIAAARGHGHAATLTTLLGVTNAVGRCESHVWANVKGRCRLHRSLHGHHSQSSSHLHALHLRDRTLFRPRRQVWP
jgi:hypothetical protein